MSELEKQTNSLSSPADKKHWEALFRGSVLSTHASTLVSYVTIADQKAQLMLFLNSLIIPSVIPSLQDEGYRTSALIALITAFVTIILAIMAVMPRGANRFNEVERPNLLHFATIKRFKTFEQYLNEIKPIYNDPQKLGQESLRYIYDTSLYILKGKYFWLRLCYIIFLVGNFSAITTLIFML